MKNALTKNLGWKALSLALALVIARVPARATSLPLLGTPDRAAIGTTEEPAAVEGFSAVPQSGFHRP